MRKRIARPCASALREASEPPAAPRTFSHFSPHVSPSACGGWCFSASDCAGRAGGGGGSSNGYAGSTAQIGGLLSADPAVNPRFFNYSLVFIHYCDGSSHTSNATNPIPTDPGATDVNGAALTQIWMRGRPNLAAVLSYLMSAAGGSLGAVAGTEVILSGGSAGGTAAFLALDWVASFLPSTVKLVGAPDAGYFIDAPVWNEPSNYNFRHEFQSGDAIWNSVGSGSLNHACLAAYPTEGWRCFFPELHTPYLKTPWHAMMAAYDVASTSMIIDLCSPPSPCSAAELAALQLWRFTFVGQLAYGLDSYPGNGAYIDSCIVHEQNVDYCAGQGQQNCHGWLTYNITTTGFAPQLTPQAGFSVWASARSRARSGALTRACAGAVAAAAAAAACAGDTLLSLHTARGAALVYRANKMHARRRSLPLSPLPPRPRRPTPSSPITRG